MLDGMSGPVVTAYLPFHLCINDGAGEGLPLKKRTEPVCYSVWIDSMAAAFFSSFRLVKKLSR